VGAAGQGSTEAGMIWHAGHPAQRLRRLLGSTTPKRLFPWILRSAVATNVHGQIAGAASLHGRPAAYVLTPKAMRKR